jgi:hypothetical protein
MDSFQIADGLVIEKDPRGAMVTYITSTAGEADVFHVGLSYKSLRACQKSLSRQTSSWETTDGSFRVIKADGKVTLVFWLQGPPHGTKELQLTTEEISRFDEAVATLAAGLS